MNKLNRNSDQDHNSDTEFIDNQEFLEMNSNDNVQDYLI